MANRQETTLSKIEQKIFKNTFLSNSNDLHFKDDTKKSQLSITSKQQSLFSPKTFDISQISQISNHQIDLIRLFAVQELDLSGISFHMTNETVENLQETIRVSMPGSVITLPPRKIQFPYLLITSPITLKGLPGTCIEITHGSIIVDFSSHSRESIVCSDTEAALICEIAFQYTLDNSFKPSSTTPPVLIILDSNHTYLEIRDCDLRSNNHEPSTLGDENAYIIEDSCFWINGIGYRKSINKNSMRFVSSLFISSCNISNFYECCRAGVNSSLVIERSHIAGCCGSAINIMNPRELSIKNSVIDKIEKTAVDVNIITDPSAGIALGTSRTESLNSLQNERTLVIEGNDIRNTGGYGINLWCDNVSYYPIQCRVTQNKISNCKKEGIAVRHLNISGLWVDSNESSENEGTGYWLQKVTAGKLRVYNNRSYDNYSGYGLYIYDTGGVVKNNEFLRNTLGGIMVVGASKGTNTNLHIKNSLIQCNGENGITIMDYSRGNINISHCNISENSHDGIYLVQTRDYYLDKHKEKDKNKIPSSTSNAHAKIRSCELNNNAGYGLNIVKFRCTIEKLHLSDNQQGNIMIAEDTKQYVEFLDDNKVDVNVQVGQNCIIKEKPGLCGRNRHKCYIF